MPKNRKIISLCIVFILFGSGVSFSQNRYALVIGNGNYTGLTKLNNPVNDANDMASALQKLGFTVDKVLNGTQDQMDTAVIRLKNRLSVSSDTYGFFFYAGHGVQSQGENYLIPVDANIPSENALRSRAVSVQMILDDLNDAKNSLNVIVLDACRDNPFSWSRSGSRGLSIVSRQPADSIIVYATSAGQRASDGEGRNGLFTSQLLKNISDPNLEIMDVFRRTGMNVAEASQNQQIPAIYSQAFRTAYLGTPVQATPIAGATSAAPEVVQTAAPASPLLPVRPDKPEKQAKPERVKPEREPQERVVLSETRLWIVGASVGSSFADPFFVGTVRGTLAPFNYSFFELGLDFGLVSGIDDVQESWSLCPFAHYAFFLPVSDVMGIYAGAGGGYFTASYTFINAEEPVNTGFFAADMFAGFSLWNMLDISYTFRTNFSRTTNKLSIGYIYRF